MPISWDLQEMWESRKLSYNSDGITGQRQYRIFDWYNIEINDWGPSGIENMPTLGSHWVDVPESPLYKLIAIQIDFQETGAGTAVATVQYSSNGFPVSDYMSTDIDCGLDEAGFGPGWVWSGSNIPVSENQSYVIPSATYTIRLKNTDLPKSQVQASLNMVNNAVWHGFAAETLLFTGAKTATQRSTAGVVTAVETVFTFQVKPFSHNYVYHAPQTLKDAYGNEFYYHNDSTVGAPWSTYYVAANSPLLGSKVLVGGYGWDKPTCQGSGPYAGQTVYLHQSTNFTTSLGIPDIASPQNGG